MDVLYCTFIYTLIICLFNHISPVVISGMSTVVICVTDVEVFKRALKTHLFDECFE